MPDPRVAATGLFLVGGFTFLYRKFSDQFDQGQESYQKRREQMVAMGMLKKAQIKTHFESPANYKRADWDQIESPMMPHQIASLGHAMDTGIARMESPNQYGGQDQFTVNQAVIDNQYSINRE